MASRRVLLVGWDAADWNVIRPLIGAGRMPNLRRLVEAGCTAPIATLHPSLSPMLWTSVATGKRPFDHGIHGFTEPMPNGQGVQRVTNLSRKCKALWNILGQNGLRSIVVGWWPSYPAEPINGAMVSDQFHRISPDFRPVPGMVYPELLATPLAALRLNPDELPADVLEFFVARARQIDQERDHRLLSVARVICECANIHSAATWLMDREPWDFCAVYFDAIDHFGHGFMKYNPPQQSWVSDGEFESYSNVVQAGYMLHDKMLGTLLEKAGDGTNLILLSDHGFHSADLRSRYIPRFHAGPVVEHRDNGVLVIAGPGVRTGADLGGVSLLDIAPTVLALFGLPGGDDMEGEPISAAFEPTLPDNRIPTWEKVDGDDGRHPPHMLIDPVSSAESLDQLIALGYVEEPDPDREKAAKNSIADLRLNLAESYQDAARHEEGAAILRELRHEDPDDQRFALRLFISAVALRNTAEMKAIAEDWSGRRRAVYDSGLARLRELPENHAESKQLRRVCRYDPALATYFQSQVLRAQRRWSEALALINAISASGLIRPGLFTDRAGLLGRLNRWQDAEQVLNEALASNSDDARLHFARSRAALHRGTFADAAKSALDGLALLNRDPYGHYLLGIALTCQRSAPEDAVRAFTRALEINSNFPRAQLWLTHIYRRQLADGENAALHSRIYREGLKPEAPVRLALPVNPGPRPVAFAASARELPPITDEVVIVSGLPRSGTSMLMQMLIAGGLEPLADGFRQPDEDNPRGYFEFEPVKQMAQDASWLLRAGGKVVKIVVPMIPNLPEGLSCRVILIERDLDEILASQRQMIARRGREVAETPERMNRLKQEYLRMVVWTKGFLASRADTKLMCVDQRAVVQNPNLAAGAISLFLGGNLDLNRMAASVRADLHRQNIMKS